MLKEKLYLEYQKRYEEYKKKHKDVEKLQEDIKQLDREKAEKIASIEREKAETLRIIECRKKENEDKLDSVKKNGVHSTVFKEFSEKRISEINSLSSEVSLLEKGKDNELKKLREQKRNAIKTLEEDKVLCQNRLNDLMNDGYVSVFVKTFDEIEIRQQLIKKKEVEVAKLSSQYDLSIEKTQKSIQNIENEYATILQRERSYIDGNHSLINLYNNLSEKQRMNKLPQVISEALQDSIESVVQRNKINGGQRLVQLTSDISSLEDLSMYIPQWLVKMVEFGLPCFIGVGLLLFFIFSGVRWGFVEIAINAIVTFLFWGICAVIGFGMLYGILTAVKGKVVGMIGGVIGAIISVLIAINWEINLHSGITNIVEWIIKVIVCIVVIMALYFLNTSTDVGRGIINLGMKLEFVKKVALTQQGYAIRENVDSYYCLLRYKEIIDLIINREKDKQSSYLNSELSRLQSEKKSAVEQLASKIDADIERKVASEKSEAEANRKKYEQSQKNLIKLQDKCMLELSSYDERISDEGSIYEEKISKVISSYDKKILSTKEKLQRLKSDLTSDKDSLLILLTSNIEYCKQEFSQAESNYDKRTIDTCVTYEKRKEAKKSEINSLQVLFKPEFDAIYELFMKIYRGGNPELVETRGMVSDTLYIFNNEELSILQKSIESSNGEMGDLSPGNIT